VTADQLQERIENLVGQSMEGEESEESSEKSASQEKKSRS